MSSSSSAFINIDDDLELFSTKTTDQLLKDKEFIDEDCELFANSSCALSPCNTLSPNPSNPLSPSPDFDYNYMTSPEDPLGLNDLFEETFNSPNSPTVGIVPRETSPVSVQPANSTITLNNKPVIKVVQGLKTTSSVPVQLAVLDADELNKILGRKGSPTHSLLSEGPCMNRNAVNARENRQKKKRYVTDLEQAVLVLTKENKAMKAKMSGVDKTINKLRTDLMYVRSILANESQLSNILSGVMKSCPDIKIHAPRLSDEVTLDTEINGNIGEVTRETQETAPTTNNKRSSKRKRTMVEKEFPAKKVSCPTSTVQSSFPQTDHTYNRRDGSGLGGICLHVSQNDVSMEMCSTCSISSRTSVLADNGRLVHD